MIIAGVLILLLFSFSQVNITFICNNVLTKADKELVELARRSELSILRKRSYDGMSDNNWICNVTNEMSARSPTVLTILSKLLDIGYQPQRKMAACLIHGMIMFLRCHELSSIQRINTVLLVQGNTSTSVSRPLTQSAT